jgi:hypothetical protein
VKESILSDLLNRRLSLLGDNLSCSSSACTASSANACA